MPEASAERRKAEYAAADVDAAEASGENLSPEELSAKNSRHVRDGLQKLPAQSHRRRSEKGACVLHGR